MSDPGRLVDGAGGDFERALLRSWSTRQPSEALRERTLVALGVGGALVSGSAAGAGAAPKGALASSSLLKWLALFFGGVAASAGVVGYVVAERAGAVEAPVARLVTAPPVGPAVPEPSPAVVPVAAATDLAVGPSAPPRAAPSTVVLEAKGTHAPASSLDEEVGAVDRARRALTGGDYPGALSIVDDYDARFPSGALVQESAEIRIEALYRSGRRAQADRLASRFLAANPSSPYARVIRALAASSPPPP